MELELVNRKNMKLQLIPLFKYKINNNKLIFFESQNSYHLFKDDNNKVYQYHKDSCLYEPLFKINELVLYKNNLYEISELDSDYTYTLMQTSENNLLIEKAKVNELQKLNNQLLLKNYTNIRHELNTYKDFKISNENEYDSIIANDVTDLIKNTIKYNIKCSLCCRCICDDNNSLNLIKSLEALDIRPTYKYILVHRYIKNLIYHENQISKNYVIFNIFRFIIQTGSILTPGLLSIQHIFNDQQPNVIYWATWLISLVVGLLANYISLFGLDKKYFTYEKSYNLLVSYGWQYLQLSGRYSTIDIEDGIVSHESMFVKFCDDIEHIILKEAQSITDAMQEITKAGEAKGKTPRQLLRSKKSSKKKSEKKNKT
jgi:hypothetical protein